MVKAIFAVVFASVIALAAYLVIHESDRPGSFQHQVTAIAQVKGHVADVLDFVRPVYPKPHPKAVTVPSKGRTCSSHQLTMEHIHSLSLSKISGETVKICS